MGSASRLACEPPSSGPGGDNPPANFPDTRVTGRESGVTHRRCLRQRSSRNRVDAQPADNLAGSSARLSEIAEELDKEIAHSTPELFLTLFVAVLNSRKKTLRQVNAGHNTQYALRADGRLHLFDPTWRPPGLLPGGGYVEQCAALATGDSILIYTTACWKHRVEPVKSSAKRRLERSLASERESSQDRLIA
ncbi:MAG: hypothetical protein EXQ58_03570 [Acidobacteria bacterium]|nr:hypothetical protein [Acidobacteriota bacterium]